MSFVSWLLITAWMALILCDAQPIILVQNEDLGGFNVDVQQFAQLYSRHIVTNRIDNSLMHLSKRMAHRFRDAFQVTNIEQDATTNSNDGVDIHILRGQLSDAVGAFVEDTLPGTWTKQASSLNLDIFIANILRNTCSASRQSDIVKSDCLREHTSNILSSTDIFVDVHLQQTVNIIINRVMPQLLDTVRDHVQAIVDHFNQHILTDSRLVLSVVPITRADDEKEEYLSTIRHSRQHTDTVNLKANPSANTIHHFSTLARVTSTL